MIPHRFDRSIGLLWIFLTLLKAVWVIDALVVVRRQHFFSSSVTTTSRIRTERYPNNNNNNYNYKNHNVVVVSLKYNEDNDDDVDCEKRRDILTNACNIVVAAEIMTTEVASAAEPVQIKDTDGIKALLQRKMRPKPPKVLRPKISQDFAVLLMRSSYNALDEMDCISMNQFQRDFFLIRASEYETYTRNVGDGMVQQGDLTDPYYFDFISFAQYKTINREIINDPLFVFEEQQIPPEGSSQERTDARGNARFVPVVVKRDPTLTNAMLIPTHSSKVGSTILDKLEETFRETELKIPNVVYRRNSSTLLSSGIRQIVSLFLINGYAFNGEVVENDAVSKKYVITLNAPVTLWGGKVLQLEGEPLDNDFLLKTITEYIRRSGYSKIKSSTKFNGSMQEITITVS